MCPSNRASSAGSGRDCFSKFCRDSDIEWPYGHRYPRGPRLSRQYVADSRGIECVRCASDGRIRPLAAARPPRRAPPAAPGTPDSARTVRAVGVRCYCCFKGEASRQHPGAARRLPGLSSPRPPPALRKRTAAPMCPARPARRGKTTVGPKSANKSGCRARARPQIEHSAVLRCAKSYASRRGVLRRLEREALAELWRARRRGLRGGRHVNPPSRCAARPHAARCGCRPRPEHWSALAQETAAIENHPGDGRAPRLSGAPRSALARADSPRPDRRIRSGPTAVADL